MFLLQNSFFCKLFLPNRLSGSFCDLTASLLCMCVTFILRPALQRTLITYYFTFFMIESNLCISNISLAFAFLTLLSNVIKVARSCLSSITNWLIIFSIS